MSTFSELTDREKESRFFEAAAILCELIDEERYAILHHELGISDGEIREHKLLSDAELMAHGVEIKEPTGQRFSVSDVIKKMDEEDPTPIILSCKSGGYRIEVERFLSMGNRALNRYGEVFAAKVLSSRASDAGLEIIIEDVSPKLLSTLEQKLEPQKHLRQTGPTLQM